MNKGKVLITGGSGFVGYHLIRAAQQAGLEVHAAIRNSSVIDHLKDNPPHFVYLSYEPEALRKTLSAEKYDYVIHAAGMTAAPDENTYQKVNATYTYNLAAAAEANGVKRFVFLSSLAAIGPLLAYDAAPMCEDKTPEPVTAYGRSKLKAEQFLQEFKNLESTILRPTAVYGPRDKDIFILFKTLKRGLEPYFGRKPQVYSFIYAPDLAGLAVKALTAPHYGTYNVSDGNVYDRYQLAAVAKKAIGSRTMKVHFPVPLVKLIAGAMEWTASRSGKTPALNKEKLSELTAAGWQCNIDKAKTELGFNPKYNLEQGLMETIDWYKKERWL